MEHPIIQKNKSYGDYGIFYFADQFYKNKQNKFFITLKGTRNDTLVMVSKKRILKDKIIVTEVYTDVEDLDSIVRVISFKNGVYVESTSKSYYNNKMLPNRINIKDLEIKKILPIKY